LFDNRKVRFVKMIVIGETKFYWRDVDDCLKMRGKPLITDWINQDEIKTSRKVIISIL
jgi:hypothetical protein